MSLRIFGIVIVFCVTSVAWLILGAIMSERTHQQSNSLRGEVVELWGNPQTQDAPQLTFVWVTKEARERTETVDGKNKTIRYMETVTHQKNVEPAATNVDVNLALDQRLKGLMWYPLYDVNLSALWQYRHTEEIPGTLRVAFRFPDSEGLYDNFRFMVNGKDRAGTMRLADGSLVTDVVVEPGQVITLESGYKSRGIASWHYRPASGVTSLEDFHLSMVTDFNQIDFPAGTMSPSKKSQTAEGWTLEWDFTRVVTGQNIGMEMPTRIQPGELASSLSYSAPISLLFFFLLLFVLATLREIDIHPINYLFLGGAFFAFHLLFGYTVDHLPIIPAFILASIASVLLVVSYLRLVVSPRFAFVEAGAAQMVYLVGFSLAHFWDGFTGLTVTILSTLTLFILMQLTGRVKWSEVLAKKPVARPRPQTPAPSSAGA